MLRVAAWSPSRYRGAVSIDVVVVLCGGAGERLWPASHPARPKPLIPLGGATLLAATVERYRSLTDRFVLVCGPEHAAAMAAEVPDAEVLVEPERRGTGPAVAAAAQFLRASDPVVLVTPADHFVADAPALRNAIACGEPFARAGELVTFGIVPDRPDTGFGYIGRAEPLGPGAHRIAHFREKPDPAAAARLVAEGYLWNSGVFLFSANGLFDQLGRHAPAVAAATEVAVQHIAHRDGLWFLDPDSFRRAPSGSFDVQLAERTERGVVVPVDCGWSDVGSWPAIARLFPSEGPDGTFVWAEDVTVQVDGVRGVGVAASPRGVRVFSIIPPEETSGAE